MEVLRQATNAIVAEAQKVSPAAAAKATALADAAEEAETNALERDLLGEASRFESDADSYERSVKEILASADADAASAAATSAVEVVEERIVEGETPPSGEGEGAGEEGKGGTPKPRRRRRKRRASGAALWAKAAAHTKDNKELLRHIHERGIAAMEMQTENNKRAAAGRLAQRKAAAMAARTEAMKAAGKSQEEIDAANAEVRHHNTGNKHKKISKRIKTQRRRRGCLPFSAKNI